LPVRTLEYLAPIGIFEFRIGLIIGSWVFDTRPSGGILHQLMLGDLLTTKKGH
jgi:hypothetical protein